MAIPTTAVFESTKVRITWSAPSNGGSTITAYSILVQKSGGSFITETINCDGS